MVKLIHVSKGSPRAHTVDPGRCANFFLVVCFVVVTLQLIIDLWFIYHIGKVWSTGMKESNNDWHNKVPHYDNVKWRSWRLKLPVNRVFVQILFRLTTKKHQRSALLSLARGIHWWTVVSPHKDIVTWKMFSFDDVIMGRANVSCGVL